MAIYQRGKSYYYDFVHKGQRYTGCIGAVSRTVAKEEEHRKKTEVIEQSLNPAKARKSPRFDTFVGECASDINLDLAFLKALLNKAVTWNKLAEYPAKHVKSLKVANERTRFLSGEEEATLLTVCSPPLRRIVEAGLLTGFRPRELTSLVLRKGSNS